MEKITFDEFYNKFKLKRNTIEHISPYENTMYDFGEKELEYLEEQNKNNVWSIRDNGKKLIIVSGLDFKDTIGYFISTKPWLSELKYELK
jgi:plasmid maintenance system killer protein